MNRFKQKSQKRHLNQSNTFLHLDDRPLFHSIFSYTYIISKSNTSIFLNIEHNHWLNNDLCFVILTNTHSYIYESKTHKWSPVYSISHTIYKKHAINALYFTHMHSYMTIRNLCYKGRGFSVLILDQKYTYTHTRRTWS